MQSFETLGRELERQGKTERIKALAESDDGQKLSRMLDTRAVEDAARSGDGEALRAASVSYTHLRAHEKKPPGIFDKLTQLVPGSLGELETEDIILLLILYLMYRESGDSELLIIMGAMFLL